MGATCCKADIDLELLRREHELYDYHNLINDYTKLEEKKAAEG